MLVSYAVAEMSQAKWKWYLTPKQTENQDRPHKISDEFVALF